MFRPAASHSLPSALGIACLLLFHSLGSAAQTAATANIQAAVEPRIIPPSLNYQFSNGKKFVYTVEWHSLSAGTATMRFDVDGSGE
jgi:hypothetical protein